MEEWGELLEESDYEFLDDFPSRFPMISKYACVFYNIEHMEFWKKYGINDYANSIQIVFYVLGLVLQFSLRGEDCTISDITDFLYEQVNIIFELHLSRENSQELAGRIIYDVIRNGGREFTFPIRHRNGAKEEYKFHLLSTKLLNQGNRSITGYTLTIDGYEFIFSSQEIPSSMQFSIEVLIGKQCLDKGNYTRSLSAIRKAYAHLTRRERELKSLRILIRGDVNAFKRHYHRSFDDVMEEDIDVMKNAQDSLRKQSEIVEISIHNITDHKVDSETLLSEHEAKSLKTLKLIKKELSKSIGMTQNVLAEHKNLRLYYLKELKSVGNIAPVRRVSFNKYWDYIMRHPSAIMGIPGFFQELFIRQPKIDEKIYNPELIFLPQKMPERREQSVYEILTEEQRQDAEEETRRAQEEIKNAITAVSESFLDVAASEGDYFYLHDVFDIIRSRESVPMLFYDPAFQRKIGLDLLNLKKIPETEDVLLSQKREGNENMIAGEMTKLLKQEPRYHNISSIDPEWAEVSTLCEIPFLKEMEEKGMITDRKFRVNMQKDD